MLMACAREHGAEVLYNTAAQQLIIDEDGACTVVVVHSGEGDIAFMACSGATGTPLGQ